MPLLMCPNDSAAMTTVERAGVQFDMCPTCRGVWLDRGELEKLMSASREEAPPAAAQPPPPVWREPQPEARPEPRYETRYERPQGDHRRHYDDDDRRQHHKKKRFDLFDIFD